MKLTPTDHHGLPVVLFDGTNGDEVAEYIVRSMDLCPDRACVGCPIGCRQALNPNPGGERE